MKIILLLSIVFFAGAVHGQIKDVSKSGKTVYIKKDNGGTSSISTCNSCVVGGFTNQFAVVVWGAEYCTSSSAGCKEVVIYNSDGDRYGSFTICKECIVKSVQSNKIVHTDASGRTDAHDFKGNHTSN